jgi:hypothetical protein
MTPTRSQTNVPGHMGIGFLADPLLFPGILGRLIPQEPVVVQSAFLFFTSSNLIPP